MKRLIQPLIAVLITSFTSWSCAFSPAQESPLRNASARSGSASCLSTLVNATTDITQGRSIEMRLSFANIEGYPDSPLERPHQIILAMSGDDNEKVMELGGLQSSIANNLFRACDSAGMVTFAVANSGYVFSYGVMKDGSVKAFECIDTDLDNRKLLWGKQICNA